MRRLPVVRMAGAVLFGAVAFGAVESATAQTFPSRPITIICPCPIGTGVDTVVRVLAPHFQARLKQPVLVENRTGAGGMIAAEAVVRAAPDGHTVMYSPSNLLVFDIFLKNPTVKSSDLVPMAAVENGSYLLVAPASMSVKNLKEFIAHAKANPGKLNLAVLGNSSQQLDLLRLRDIAGLKMEQVSYTGGPPMSQSTATGQTHLTLQGPLVLKPWIDKGMLVALAATGKARNPATPNTPTAQEMGIPYVAEYWVAFFGTTQFPKSLIARWHSENEAVFAIPEVRERLKALNSSRIASSPEELAGMMARDAKQNADIARIAGIKTQ